MDTQNKMEAVLPPSLQVNEINKPHPASNQVLVEISHAAQNPTDVQSFDANAFGDKAVYGCDFVGKVIQVGDKVSRLVVGDVISALIWGGEIEGLGAYSQYTVADEKICFKLPQGISRAQAATIPLAAATAWLAIFSQDCLHMDRNKQQSVLIWGGSSSVGQYAIQLATLYGFNVVTTCSSHNFDLVKSLGAAAAFDYKSSSIVDDISSAAPDLAFIFDTIGNETSSETASKAVHGSGKLCTVRPGKGNTEKVTSNVSVSDVLVWTSFFKDHSFGKFTWPASEADHNLSAELFEKIPALLDSGKLKPNRVLELEGLRSIPKGFEMYRKGEYSAQKIVYTL